MAKAVHVMYSSATIYTVGHSLGGALASLAANTLGFTAVGFNSPPDRLVTESLSLNVDSENIYHFGSGSDPIFLGQCNAVRPFHFLAKLT
jgi:lipase ATG15